MFDLKTALTELSRYKSYISDIMREVQLYEQLYCFLGSAEILNKNITSVFSIIQKSMFISILTRVSAVFDSKAMGSNENLSLDFLEHKYRAYASDALLLEFSELKNRYEALNIKAFRNKLIAHNDLATVLGAASVSHTIKDGDIMNLLQDAHKFCVHLCEGLPGGIDAVLRVEPWQLRAGDDGFELLRRLEAGK
ncbi:AbiU2 domain-containing protein [Pseudomonas sp. 7SR1]|uniref:AbiU2 domain-containing protein n=1 Tax=Pseudomonas sp. 7SR1 TaxID=1881017 RepID=UPI0009537FC8|nr:hypothetical protein [Pseudomonas sp. 7SR1]ROO33423.1 hypothetical protein BIV09_23865 [Pseudomonas sp. 7SR1]SIS23106.1 hypothetical protein SAMN05428955_3413 [Pseudomonas sp. 7SR1]